MVSLQKPIVFCLTLLLPVILLMSNVNGANILFVGSLASPSHFIWNKILVEELAEQGHNVTFMTPDEDKNPNSTKKWTHILLEGVYEVLAPLMNPDLLAKAKPYKSLIGLSFWCKLQCEALSKSQQLRNILDYPKNYKFDLIIIDVTASSCLYPLIHRFNYPPTVGVTAFLLPSDVSHTYGNNLHPSYIPWHSVPYTGKMSFLERLRNHFYTYIEIFLRDYFLYPEEHGIVSKTFGDVPPMKDLERHISLVLANTDPVLDRPQPLPPNIIPVGGLHTRKSRQIPQDLQDLLDKSTQGVILFSLGTNVRSDLLGKERINALLDTFSRVPETVIWKFESDLEGLPKNVVVRKWLPQNDILGHRNVKLFIGHGGALSTQETIYHGVPIVGVPFIVDQHVNVKMIEERQLGVKMDHTKITSDYVVQTIKEVLNNPIYRDNVRKLSAQFRDRTETPLQRALFWIEYILRHPDANLSVAGRNMSLVTSTGLDIILVLVTTIVLSLVILWKILYFTLTKLSTKRKIKTN